MTKRRKPNSSRGAAPSPDESSRGVARPNSAVRTRRPKPPTGAASWPLVETLCTAWIPTLVVTAIAYAAVSHGFTTSPEYVHSPRLLGMLKRSFVVLVCLANRSQLADVFLAPQKPKTLSTLCWSHVKALLVAIVTNCAGAAVIQPSLGLTPQFAKTVEMVVPVYFSVEMAIGLLGVPERLIQLVVGFLVSWLKAVTVSTLVMQWQQYDGAHPVGFVLISTANLSASGLAARFVGHCHRSRRLFAPNLKVIRSLVETIGTAAFIGMLAHVANQLMTQQERQREATVLYYVVAWYTLNKYFKPPLRAVLALPFANAKAKTA
ncbi:hypothetical protein ATCC90586_006565 [Pythium insidiosum]|nr:hypothetical protein ATCC90586_006565 [Pythium insidiosum]